MTVQNPHFSDSSALKGRESQYVSVTVDAKKILKNWQKSLFSFEWLTPAGAIRAPDDMPLREREKRLAVEQTIKAGQPLERPVLGIGVMDNIEIGAGKAVFLTLAAHGHKSIPVSVPQSVLKDFSPFIVPD